MQKTLDDSPEQVYNSTRKVTETLKNQRRNIRMKYFSTLRPVSIGTYPKPQGNRVDAIVNFDEAIFVAEIGRSAWGYIEYEHPLTAEQAEAYELIKGKEE